MKEFTHFSPTIWLALFVMFKHHVHLEFILVCGVREVMVSFYLTKDSFFLVLFIKKYIFDLVNLKCYLYLMLHFFIYLSLFLNFVFYFTSLLFIHMPVLHCLNYRDFICIITSDKFSFLVVFLFCCFPGYSHFLSIFRIILASSRKKKLIGNFIRIALNSCMNQAVILSKNRVRLSYAQVYF